MAPPTDRRTDPSTRARDQVPIDFTAIDFETANPRRSSACAIGMARVRDGRVVERFARYVCPVEGADCFSPWNTAVHGIGPVHVAEAPTWRQLFPAVREFMGKDVLLAHNAAFDSSVLLRTSEASGLRVADPGIVCTIKVAKSLLTLDSYALPAVSRALGLASFAHHDAGADAEAAAMVAVALAHRAGVDDVERLAALATPARSRSRL